MLNNGTKETEIFTLIEGQEMNISNALANQTGKSKQYDQRI
jgi:hypothetical protein